MNFKVDRHKQPARVLPLVGMLVLSLLAWGCSSAEIPDTGLGGVPILSTSASEISPEAEPVYPADSLSGGTLITTLPHPVTPTPPAPTALSTHTASPSPTREPSPTAIPSSTPTPPPSPTPFQLTEGGCCPQPFWSSDSASLFVVGSPQPGSETGLWKVPLEGSQPEFVTTIMGVYSSDTTKAAFPIKGQTLIEDLQSGDIWLVPNGGRKVYFSPDATQIAWTEWVLLEGKRFLRPVWVSQVDGTGAKEITALYGLGFAGWFPDGRLLVHGRYDYNEEFNAYWAVSLEDGKATELARGFRVSYGTVSPGGRWIAYHNVLDPRDEENGLWVVDTLTLERNRLEVFGPFQWREEGILVVIPLEFEADFHRLIEVDVEEGTERSPTDPEAVSMKIAGGDWAISPDGRWLAYVSSGDYNIWVLELP